MVKETTDELKELLKIPSPKKVSYKSYGGFWRRVLAAIIDAIVIGAIGFVPTVGWLISVVYHPILIGFYGQTVGKKLLGMKVVNKNDETPIGLFDAVVREWIGKFVFGILNLFLFLGAILLGFDSKKEGVHDKIAKTHVVMA